MVTESTSVKRSKPKFLSNDWHKKIKLGSTVKKNRKWRGAKGRHNKLRLNRKGHQQRPKVGWSSDKVIRGLVSGLEVVKVENVSGLNKIGKGQGALIGKVGKKNREEIILKAKEMKIQILNRYKILANSLEDGKTPSQDVSKEKGGKNAIS